MQIYNTLRRKKEELIPIEPGRVKIYACGPTVYNYFHIGNARPFIVFDTLRRYLEYCGYKVTFVQNFTDIDDKMIRRANEEGVTVQELGERFIAEYYTDADALGIRRATHNPRATGHMGDIIRLTQTLIDNGHAYATANGDVYFGVRSYPDYGKLSGQSIDDLDSGARIDPAEQKRDPLDFALWKGQKPGEPAWDSPWGKGRPGWHNECSAMSMGLLGETFDIHAGGQDLIFPHHENEIAQSEAATGKPFARYWMHNGYINVNNQKMSKSLDNFFTVRDISKEYDLIAVRLFMLGAHYKSPINFSRDLLDQAEAALARLRTAAERLGELVPVSESMPGDDKIMAELSACKERFCAAMDDDLNTADALGVLFDLARACNTLAGKPHGALAINAAQSLYHELAGVLGLPLNKKEDAIPEDVLALHEERLAARARKDWARADTLRDALKGKGYVVEDGKQGAKLKKI
ncbi:MAG: cysteine--tRNA ligase [Clostridiales bacterium]|jgi:cysteinyl-tRNA synthetase|nr:cysteine--tRNA ligase [Clostridiales bacterium]